ncbi:hypothetical protein EAI_13165, partial [Harpegnathos saltator]
QPPQHSYKRKRDITFNFSNDSDQEDEENVKTYVKKKKPNKMEKQNRKRLEEWARTINNTFQEIDEYDLLIE